MRTLPLSITLLVAFFVSLSHAALKLNLAKTNHPTSLSKRYVLPRHESRNVYLELSNNIKGGSYAAKISVGTPPQEQDLVIDTGSSDVWFMDSTALRCSDPYMLSYFGGCSSIFNSSVSTSLQLAARNAFNITYLDDSAATGDYVRETLVVGNSTIKSQIVGLAYVITVRSGIMGIGFRQNVASNKGRRPLTYDTVIESMFNQKLINLKAYSLYLDSKDSETGSVIFGGLDTSKYLGNLLEIPLVPTKSRNGSEVFDHFTIAMKGLQLDNGTSSQNFTSADYRSPVVLDSGTTLTYLPDITVRQIYTQINAIDDTEGREATGYAYVDCNIASNSSAALVYHFGDSRESIEIRVLISELLYTTDEFFRGSSYLDFLPALPFKNVCVFGILPAIEGISILGDTFLRSAYVVYDLSNNVVAMAQANPNSTSENIVDFEVGATAIPRVSGVASVVEVTQTATFVGGIGNGARPTGTNTVRSTNGLTSVGSSVVTSSAGERPTSPPTPSPTSQTGGSRGMDHLNSMAGLGVLFVSMALLAMGSGF